MLTTFQDDEYVKEALKIGAKGYILKQDFAGVIPAIRAVYSGQSVWGNEIISRIPDMIKDKDDAAYSVYSLQCIIININFCARHKEVRAHLASACRDRISE